MGLSLLRLTTLRLGAREDRPRRRGRMEFLKVVAPWKEKKKSRDAGVPIGARWTLPTHETATDRFGGEHLDGHQRADQG